MGCGWGALGAGPGGMSRGGAYGPAAGLERRDGRCRAMPATSRCRRGRGRPWAKSGGRASPMRGERRRQHNCACETRLQQLCIPLRSAHLTLMMAACPALAPAARPGPAPLARPSCARPRIGNEQPRQVARRWVMRRAAEEAGEAAGAPPPPPPPAAKGDPRADATSPDRPTKVAFITGGNTGAEGGWGCVEDGCQASRVLLLLKPPPPAAPPPQLLPTSACSPPPARHRL